MEIVGWSAGSGLIDEESENGGEQYNGEIL